MTDRYANIRKALADMDAAAEARNAIAWRDAHARFVVHVPPDTIRELLAERDQLAAALEAAREDGWQPIETAPRDGTRVLLWIEWSDVPVVGEFSHDRWRADTEHYEVSCGAFCYGGSVSSDMKPTHWRPLPSPPAIDQARGKGVQDES